MSRRRETGFAVAASALLHLAAAGLVLWGGGDCAPAPEQSREGGESRSPSAAPTRVRLVSEGGSGAARAEPSTGGAVGTGATRADPSTGGAVGTDATRAEPSTGGATRTDAMRAESSTGAAAQPGSPRVEQAPATAKALESTSTEPSAVPSGDADASGSLASPGAPVGSDHDAGEQAPSAGESVSAALESPGGPPQPSGASPGSGASATTPGASSSGPAAVGGGQSGSAPGTAEDFALLQRRLATAATGCYPEQARRMRLQGELRLEFCVDGRGEAIGVRVVGGSGVPLLDRAATDCLIPRAFPVPEVRGGCFQVPVHFGRN